MWLPVCFIFLCVSQVMAGNYVPPVVVDASCKDCLAHTTCDPNGEESMLPSISMCVKVTCSSGGEATVCGHAIFNKTRKCVDGNYEAAQICTEPPVMCPVLGNPANGIVSYSDSQNVGSIATYQCDTCYSLIGNIQRVCQNDGSWSNDEPTCYAPVPGNMFAYAGSCYNVREDASKTWDEAKSTCEAENNGYLAELTSSAEIEAVTEWIDSTAANPDESQRKDLWFGLHDIEEEGNFKWAHSNSQLNEENWFTGEPNNLPNGQGDCVRMGHDKDYQWRDMTCVSKYGFVCEYAQP